MIPNAFFETVESRFHDWRYGHPRILYGLIRAMKPETVIEIGSYRGYAACYMARALQENDNNGRVYCIDDFSLSDHAARYGDPKAHWEENLRACGVMEIVTLIEGDSRTVQWPDYVDFAYVDGWHSYEVCKHDCEKAIALGAQCLTFDDSVFAIGPRKYLNELRERPGWDVACIRSDGGLAIATPRTEMPRVIFEQEMPNHPGTSLHEMSESERRLHFDLLKKSTGVDYGEFF